MTDSPVAFEQRLIAHLYIQQLKKEIVYKALPKVFFVILNYNETSNV